MSVQSQITRITSAKTAIKNAIIAKGVTVPAAATIDSYSTYIANIPAGGGLAYINTTATTLTPSWDTCYQWTNNVTSLTINAPSAPSDSTVEIVLKFRTGSSTPSISFPDSFLWLHGITPSIVSSTTYEISLSYDMVAAAVTACITQF